MPTEELKYVLTAQDKGVAKALGGIKSGIGGISAALPGALGPLSEIIERSKQMGEHFETEGKKSIKVLGGIGAAGLGAGLALQQMGSGDKAAMGNLRNAIENLGGSWDEYDKKVEATIKSGERFGQTAATTQDVLATLTQATGDPALALKYYNTVLDLSVAKHEDARTAATQLAQAYNGSARILHQFGISGLKGQEAIDALASKLKGDASTSADTFSGHLESLRAKVEDAAASFGNKYGPAISTVSGALLTLSVGYSAVNGALEAHRAKQAAAAIASAETAAALEAEGAAGLAAGGEVAAGAEIGAAGIGSLKVALISTGIGALLVGIGTAIAFAFGNDSTQAVKDFTSAIEADTGAIAENARQMAAKHLLDEGLLALANKYGLSVQDITDASIGDAAARDRVTAAMKAQSDAMGEIGTLSASEQNDQLDRVVGFRRIATAIGEESDAVKKAKSDYDLLHDATDVVATATSDLSVRMGRARTDAIGMASGMRGLAPELDKNAAAAKAVSDRINDMNTSLKNASGEKLGIAIAKGEVFAAGRDYAASVKENGKSLDPKTKAGLANLQAQQRVNETVQALGQALTGSKLSPEEQKRQLQAVVGALPGYVGKVDVADHSADGGSKAKIDAQIATLRAQKTALGDNTSTFGMSAKAIASHAASVERSTVKIDNHIARLQAQKAGLKDTATQEHISATAADALAGSIGKIPTSWKTVSQLDIASAMLKGQQFKAFLATIKDKTVRLDVIEQHTIRVNATSAQDAYLNQLLGRATSSNKTTVHNHNGPVHVHGVSYQDALRQTEKRARLDALAGR